VGLAGHGEYQADFFPLSGFAIPRRKKQLSIEDSFSPPPNATEQISATLEKEARLICFFHVALKIHRTRYVLEGAFSILITRKEIVRLRLDSNGR